MNFLELKLQPHWIHFGHCLKISFPDLQNIELNIGHDKRRCIRQVLLVWSQSNPAASWEPIAEALKRIGFPLLSAIVTKHYTSHQSFHGLEYDYYDVLASISSMSFVFHEVY